MKKFNSSNPKKNTNLTSPVINVLLNVAIFFLAALIIFMGYSLYLKLSFNTEKRVNSEKGIRSDRIIQVDVRNGCGISGIADRYTSFLRSKGFDVAEIGNYISSDVDQTLVIDRIGNKKNAEIVAEALGVKTGNIISQLNKDYFIDVSVIIGKDYLLLTPFK